MQNNHHNKGQSEVENFQQWLASHSPQMLTGLKHWLYTIVAPARPAYHLPLVDSIEEERQLQLKVMVWVLSGVLPTIYLGALHSDRKVCSHNVF